MVPMSFFSPRAWALPSIQKLQLQDLAIVFPVSSLLPVAGGLSQVKQTEQHVLAWCTVPHLDNTRFCVTFHGLYLQSCNIHRSWTYKIPIGILFFIFVNKICVYMQQKILARLTNNQTDLRKCHSRVPCGTRSWTRELYS